MRRSKLFPTIALLAGAAALGLAAVEDREKTALDHLAWLQGTWEGPFEGGTWESVYSSPEAGMMLSMSKEWKAGRISMFEFERFTWDGGKVVLVPYPYGNASVEFELVDFDPKVKRARFANPEHDFPTDLIYERKGDRLVIDVFAGEGEQKHGFQLDLKRVE